MRTRFLATIVALVGWALFAPTPWTSLAHAQVYITEDDDSGSGIQHDSVQTSYGASLINYTPTVTQSYNLYCTTWGSGVTMSASRILVRVGPISGNGAVILDNTAPMNTPMGGPSAFASHNGFTRSVTLTAGVTYAILLSYTGPAVAWPGDDNYLFLYTATTPPPPPPPVLPSGNILTANSTATIPAPANIRTNANGISFTFTLQPGAPSICQTYTGATYGLPNAYNDSYIYLLNPAGQVVSFDDDTGANHGGGSWSSYLVYTAPATGVYTLWVCTYFGNSPLPFHLTVNGPTTPPPPPPPVGIPNCKLAPPAGSLEMRPMFAFTNLNLEGDVYPVVFSPRIERPSLSIAIPSNRIA